MSGKQTKTINFKFFSPEFSEKPLFSKWLTPSVEHFMYWVIFLYFSLRFFVASLQLRQAMVLRET